MPKNFSSRFNDDTAESLTISQILWIVFTVVLVLFVGKLIFDAVSKKGKAVSDCIQNSNTLFSNNTKDTCANTTATVPQK